MLIMEGGDLMLVGTKPVSLHPGPQTTAPTRPLSQTYTASPHANKDSGRVSKFFEENGQGRVVPQQQHQQRSRPASRQKKHAPSYVDDTLFGKRSIKQGGNSAWETDPTSKSAGKTYMYGHGDRSEMNTHRPPSSYKRGSHTERPASPKKCHPSTDSHSRPSSARPDHRPTSSMNKSLKRQPMKIKHTPSYVDDLLFGAKLSEPDFQAPWGDHRQKKGAHFDYTDYKTGGPPTGTCNQYGPPQKSSSRPPSSLGGSRPSTTQKTRHRASYVDDSLFGPKLSDPGWKAPWDEKTEAPQRMNIYDAFDHKVTIHHDDVDVVRPRSSITLQRKKPPSTGKPVWR